jgi:threonine dehydratase
MTNSGSETQGLSSPRLPDLDDIIDARDRIADVAVRTPLVESPALSKILGRQVYLKLECFQPIRVFKIRGAYNKISQVPEKSVVAVSSGNHGFAVAYCARILGKKSIIVLPETAVQEKVNSIIEFGGEAIKFGKYHRDREAKANEIVRTTGAAFIHPFNDPAIIAGTGTCGLEIADQLHDFDSVIVPVGGGGLISGIAIAIKLKRPKARVFGVEPEGAAKMDAALKAGHPVDMESPKSIADGLIPSTVGNLTLEAVRTYVDGMFSVSDDQILSAMRLLIKEAHIFPEPSGAASTAALLTKRDVAKLGEKVVIVVSGGNVSLDLVSKILA